MMLFCIVQCIFRSPPDQLLVPFCLFQVNEQKQYFLRNQTDFVIPTIKTVNYGSESIRVLGPKIWESLSNNLKNKDSLESFKMAIKEWKPDLYPCRLCKTYVQNIGYL